MVRGSVAHWVGVPSDTGSGQAGPMSATTLLMRLVPARSPSDCVAPLAMAILVFPLGAWAVTVLRRVVARVKARAVEAYIVVEGEV